MLQQQNIDVNGLISLVLEVNMALTEAQKRAKEKYEAKARQLIIRIYPSEQDILKWVDKSVEDGGYTPHIKKLIRDDISKRRDEIKL